MKDKGYWLIRNRKRWIKVQEKDARREAEECHSEVESDEESQSRKWIIKASEEKRNGIVIKSILKKPPTSLVSLSTPTTTRTTQWTEIGPTRWLIDSGSSFHLVGRQDLPHGVGPELRHPVKLHTAKGIWIFQLYLKPKILWFSLILLQF